MFSAYILTGRAFCLSKLSAALETPCSVEHALAHALLPNGFLVAVAFVSWSDHALDWVAFDRGFGTAGGGLGNIVWGVGMQLYIDLYGILYSSEDWIFTGSVWFDSYDTSLPTSK